MLPLIWFARLSVSFAMSPVLIHQLMGGIKIASALKIQKRCTSKTFNWSMALQCPLERRVVYFFAAGVTGAGPEGAPAAPDLDWVAAAAGTAVAVVATAGAAGGAGGRFSGRQMNSTTNRLISMST